MVWVCLLRCSYMVFTYLGGADKCKIPACCCRKEIIFASLLISSSRYVANDHSLHYIFKSTSTNHDAFTWTMHGCKSFLEMWKCRMMTNCAVPVPLYVPALILCVVSSAATSGAILAVLRCFAKKNCDGILRIWSTKWSLFIKLFIHMGCKSRDGSNDAN